MLLLIGLRRSSGSRLALSGLLGGLALFARPFDAILVAAPFVLWLLYANRHRVRRLAWAFRQFRLPPTAKPREHIHLNSCATA